MTERFETDLAALLDACRAGLDLGAVLGIACSAVAAELDAAAVAAYTISGDGSALELTAGTGPRTVPAPASLEPVVVDARAVLPLVSARRTLGCIVATNPGTTELSRAAILAAVSAQAVEVAHLWDAAGAGGGTIDLLTGLPNHRGFQVVLGRELSRAKRMGSNLAVCVVDIDRFAAYNDARGKAEGDRLLRLVGECFSRGMRSYDCVCRLGGDEFALVLPGMTATSAASLVARLGQTVTAWGSRGERPTVSGGVAAFPEHAATQAGLVDLAIEALEEARRAGPGRVVSRGGMSAVAPAVDPETQDGRSSPPAASRMVSEWTGHVAGELGLGHDEVERLRVAALLYDPARAPVNEGQLADRVASGALDPQAPGWLAAVAGPPADAPRESRIIAVAAAFVTAGGGRGGTDAGRALAALWAGAGGRYDTACVRALERLVADQAELG